MINIRRADLNDLEQLTKLFESYRLFYRQEANPIAASKFLNQRLSNQDSEIFVAKNSDSNQLVGFTQLYPSFSSTRMRRVYILNDLFVDLNHRGLGVSKLLIKEAKKFCISQNAFGLSLETENNNEIGNKLYPKVGFKLDTNNFYYWINE